jgi:CO/xanthine dehydrogenase Mo-binding subunit
LVIVAEQAIDALAEKLGIDPVELRLRNLPTAFPQKGSSAR